MNTELWKTDDKQWMKQRKEEWKKIVNNLNILSTFIKKKHYKYHKNYFFTGDFCFEDEYCPSGVFGGGRLIFEMWYHPVSSLDAYQKLIGNRLGLKTQHTFFNFNRVANVRSKITDLDYGFMGGREEFMVKALFPSYDYEDTQTVIGLDGKEHGVVHLAPSPKECLRYVISALPSLFVCPNQNPYSPGQYLIDHLDHCIDKVDLHKEGFLLKKELFIEAIYVIRYQSKHPKFQKNNPVIVGIANRLKARFDNREFGSTLMDYWDNIEDLYKEFVESQD